MAENSPGWLDAFWASKHFLGGGDHVKNTAL